jgi:dTDP-4-dehydrorhamnose reductase
VLELWADHFALVAPTHAELDVLDYPRLAEFLRQSDAGVVVNLAAWADVDGAEAERGDQHGRVYRLNAEYPGRLASLCGQLGKHLLHVSTDYVFDGARTERPYVETDVPNPVSWYATTKWVGEQRVLESGVAAGIARIEMPFSGRGSQKRDFPRTVVARLQAGQPMSGVTDQRITPIFLDDAARALRLLVDARYTGVVHVAASDWTTPFTFARSIARRLDLNEDLIQPEQFEVFATTRAARRPQYSWLDVSLFAKLFGKDVLRPVEAELDIWVDQLLSVPIRA